VFFGFESGFTRNPFIFMDFPFLETIPTQLPNPTHFFGFFGLVWPGFFGLIQPMNIPTYNWFNLYQSFELNHSVCKLFNENISYWLKVYRSLKRLFLYKVPGKVWRSLWEKNFWNLEDACVKSLVAWFWIKLLAITTNIEYLGISWRVLKLLSTIKRLNVAW